LRRVAVELGLPFDRLRADPTGLRPEDLDELAEGWPDYNRPDLFRAFLRSVAGRIALDRLPPFNRTAA
jgi:hypothetical protein